MLVCDCLLGEGDVSVAFQHLAQVRKMMFQCSANTSGPIVSAFMKDALNSQESLNKNVNNSKLVLVGFDEAGLVKENRQALKSLHDILDARLLGIVLMSNTTLDAAKTSRTVQLLQTQASSEDLNALVWGIVVDEGTIDSSVLEDYQEDWQRQIAGFCDAFTTLKNIIPDHWFHSRDFVFTCRMLRYLRTESPNRYLFTSDQLMKALRRHFQPVDPRDFPKIAHHFLSHCGFTVNEKLDLSAQVLQSIRQSLQDRPRDHTDITSIHCRFMLLLDPSDSETTVDILKELQIFNTEAGNKSSSETVYQTISDFPDDQTPTRYAEVLNEVTKAVERGKTLLLSNSGPIQSSLYDLINRYYQIVTKGGIKHAYANIALGSFPRQVRVHPEFRLIIILPKSQLLGTPLPFLNRFEKFTLSVREVLKDRIEELTLEPFQILTEALINRETIKPFFEGVQQGVEDFLERIGGPNAFYGISSDETIPALILQYIQDIQRSGNFNPYNRLKGMSVDTRLSPRWETSANTVHDHAQTAAETSQSNDTNIQPGEYGNLEQHDGYDEIYLQDDANRGISFADRVTTRMKRIIRMINFQLMENAKTETIFRLRDFLPSEYMREFLYRQNHFSTNVLIKSILRKQDIKLKIVLYTRTDFALTRLNTFQNKEFAKALFFDGPPHVIQYVYSKDSAPKSRCSEPSLTIFQLSSFRTSGSESDAAISACFEFNEDSTFLLVAYMKEVTSGQITSVRRRIDELMDQRKNNRENYTFKMPKIIFLLHMSADQTNLRSCYQTIPLNDWTSTYIDSFCSDENLFKSSSLIEDDSTTYTFEDDTMKWIYSAFNLYQDNMNSNISLQRSIVLESLNKEIKSTKFSQIEIPEHLRKNAKALSVLMKRADYKNRLTEISNLQKSGRIYKNPNNDDLQWLFEELKSREYLIDTLFKSFDKFWRKLLQVTLNDVCTRLQRGMTSRGFTLELRGAYRWLLSDFMRTVIFRDIANDWSLEAILSLPTNDYKDVAIVKLTNYLLTAIISTYFGSRSQVQVGLLSIKCRSAVAPSKLPLFGSLMRILDSAVITGTSLANRNRSQQHLNKIEKVERIVRKILLKNAELAKVIMIIESDEAITELFLRDFIYITLEYHMHTDDELKVLVLIGEAILKEVNRSQELNLTKNNIFHWLLYSTELKSELFEYSKLLYMLRAENKVASGIFDELMSSQISSLASLNSFFRRKFCSSLREDLLCAVNLSNYDHRTWMKRIRDISSLGIFNESSHDIMATNVDAHDITVMLSIYTILSRVPDTSITAMTLSRPFHIHYDDDSGLSSVLMLLLNFSEMSDASSIPAITLDCLSRVSRSCYSSPNFPILLGGLLGKLQLSCSDYQCTFDQGLVSQLYQRAFNLSTVARSQIIHEIISMAPSQQMKENVTNKMNQMLIDEVHPGNMSAYVPNHIRAGITSFIESEVFQNMTNVPSDVSYTQFINTEMERVLFRVVYLEENTAPTSLAQCVIMFRNSTVRNDILGQVKKSCAIQALLDACYACISQTKNSETIITSLGGEDILSVIKSAIGVAPRAWSIYLLSRFTDQALLTIILHDKILLEALGIQYWLQSRQNRSSIMTENEYTNRTRIDANGLLYRKLLGLTNSYSLIEFEKCNSSMHFPSLEDILSNPSDASLDDNSDSDLVNAAKKVVQMINDPDLQYLKYLPIIVSMHAFIRDKFNYLLKNEEEARSIIVIDALCLLTKCDQIVGNDLFLRFLEAWEQLRRVFQIFHVCSNETRTGGTEINPFEDPRVIIPRLSRESTTLGNLLEFGTTEKESYTARMINTVFIFKMDDILDSSSLTYLRESDIINPCESIVLMKPHKCSLTNVSRNFNCQHILSGPNDDRSIARRTAFDNFLKSHVEVISDDRHRPQPPVVANIQNVDSDSYYAAAKERLAAEAQTEVAAFNESHASNDYGPRYLICPQCDRFFYKEDRCASVVCAWSYHANHRTERNESVNPGCGFGFNQSLGTVRRPGNGVPIHPHFYSNRAPVNIPSHLLDVPIPIIPPAVKPIISYKFDWVSMARYVLATEIQGKMKFDKSEEFYRPIRYITTSDGNTEELEEMLRREELQQETLRQKLQSKNLPDSTISIFYRLKLIFEHIEKLFHTPNIVETIDAQEHRTMENYFGSKTDKQLEDLSDIIYGLSEYLLVKADAMILNEDTSSLIDESIGNVLSEYCRRMPDMNKRLALQEFKLQKTICSMTLRSFPALLQYLADQGIRGGVCANPTFRKKLSLDDRTNLDCIRGQLLQRINAKEDLSSEVEELKSLGAEIIKREKLLPNISSDSRLRWIKDLPAYLENLPPNGLSNRILSDTIQVANYDEIIKFIRRMIGDLEYFRLRLQYNTKLSLANAEDTESSTKYVELVPLEWEEFQKETDGQADIQSISEDDMCLDVRSNEDLYEKDEEIEISGINPMARRASYTVIKNNRTGKYLLYDKKS